MSQWLADCSTHARLRPGKRGHQEYDAESSEPVVRVKRRSGDNTMRSKRGWADTHLSCAHCWYRGWRLEEASGGEQIHTCRVPTAGIVDEGWKEQAGVSRYTPVVCPLLVSWVKAGMRACRCHLGKRFKRVRQWRSAWRHELTAQQLHLALIHLTLSLQSLWTHPSEHSTVTPASTDHCHTHQHRPHCHTHHCHTRHCYTSYTHLPAPPAQTTLSHLPAHYTVKAQLCTILSLSNHVLSLDGLQTVADRGLGDWCSCPGHQRRRHQRGEGKSKNNANLHNEK